MVRMYRLPGNLPSSRENKPATLINHEGGRFACEPPKGVEPLTRRLRSGCSAD